MPSFAAASKLHPSRKILLHLRYLDYLNYKKGIFDNFRKRIPTALPRDNSQARSLS